MDGDKGENQKPPEIPDIFASILGDVLSRIKVDHLKVNVGGYTLEITNRDAEPPPKTPSA